MHIRHGGHSSQRAAITSLPQMEVALAAAFRYDEEDGRNQTAPGDVRYRDHIP